MNGAKSGFKNSNGLLYSEALYLRDSRGRPLDHQTHREINNKLGKSSEGNLDLETNNKIYFNVD